MTAISAATNSDPAHVRVVSVRLVDARVHVHTRVNIDNAAAGQCAHTHMCTHARTHEHTHVRVSACIVHTSVCARTHTHKHTHTHTHTQPAFPTAGLRQGKRAAETAGMQTRREHATRAG